MARNLTDILAQLSNALLAHGYRDDETGPAVSAAIVTCLPSHSALLTLALEAARQARHEEIERREEEWAAEVVERALSIEQPRIVRDPHHALEVMADDDLPW